MTDRKKENTEMQKYEKIFNNIKQIQNSNYAILKS